MHFMLLEHDLERSPGRYRSRDAHVHDEREGRTVYPGPDADDVPGIMGRLADELGQSAVVDTLVRAAMAHLKLAMIHPFRDGNARLERALQTLVLAQD